MSSSSPDDLSTPPGSPDIDPPGAANSNGHGSTIHVLGGAAPPPGNAPTSAAKFNNTTTTSAPATAAPKKPRKKRESAAAANANANGDEKPKRAPRTRAPKDPNAPPQRKKRKTAAETAAAAAAAAPPPAHVPEDKPAPPPHQHQPSASRQPKITDLVGTIPAAPSPHIVPSNPEPIPNPAVAHVVAATPPNPRPASSGQLYDPIRSSTVPVTQNHHSSSLPPVSPPARVVNRASASPSINSLIDPPSVTNQTHLAQQNRFQPPMSVTSAPASPALIQAKPNPFGPSSETAQVHKPPPMHTTPMEGIEQPQPLPSPARHHQPQPPQHLQAQLQPQQQPQPQPQAQQTLQPAPTSKKAESAGSSGAPTPPAPQKSTKPKEAAPPPLPGGGGLLSSVPFVGSASGKDSSAEGTNIWLTFPLKGQTNVTINFAREVEKKYGFAALHPRVAAARERRRQMAAAAAALERGSGAASADDMSVDLSEPESNVEMGGMEEELTQEGKKRQRKKKVEDYDKDDDFIDDTELAWEQSALMAKDGFFVYSGPLITEGEKPSIEKNDGSNARGRGRGRGRGGATRGDTTASRGRGGGRGSRGGVTTRKPRVTKADRAMMEAEKMEREKMAATLAAKPVAPYPGTVS
ncbi:histone promoter control 2 [Diplodia corticola]|uniref:Histone promoter control 2 n=1 Tax=Diplodia corticola TaxID=236234 RepID=A0A1J9RSQ7_9PEZI|nr:histone promoter control 2 [Diplodia corticola]OJD35587.1 histone promoter control 2 [Diplodia corticola]